MKRCPDFKRLNELIHWVKSYHPQAREGFVLRAVNRDHLFEEMLEALLHAHGIIDNANPNDHDGALYCKCETAMAYQKAKAEAQS